VTTAQRQPLAVRAINSAGGMARRFGVGPGLDMAALLAAAEKSTGLHDFGPDSFREGLRVLLGSLEGDARLTTIGRLAARTRIVNLLETRLRLIEHRRRHPEVAEEAITRPIFVLGLPRTGTTVLYGMLAANPALRSPSSWEVARPFPPPSLAQRDDDPRIAQTDKEFDRFRRIAPGLDRMHPLGAQLPQECLALHAPAFASYEFPMTFPVHAYWQWLRDQDLRDAYEFQRWFLQHLQSGHAGEHWILKTPAHLMWFSTLLAVFPDALLVQTHRSPTAVLASVSSLMVALRRSVSEHVDAHAVGRENLDAWTWGLERTMHVRDQLPPGRVVDVHYRDTVDDPVGTVHRIYEQFGIPMSPAVEEGVRAYLAENPRDKHGVHRYALSDFGLDRDEVDAAFAGYRARFDVEDD
jgi:hypothetical protein